MLAFAFVFVFGVLFLLSSPHNAFSTFASVVDRSIEAIERDVRI
jgi:hypothetical protein